MGDTIELRIKPSDDGRCECELWHAGVMSISAVFFSYREAVDQAIAWMRQEREVR